MYVFCYIIETCTGLYYTGISKNVHKRFLQHCKGHSIFFRHNTALRIIYSQRFNSYVDARKLEIYVKSIGARRFLEGTLQLKGKREKDEKRVVKESLRF